LKGRVPKKGELTCPISGNQWGVTGKEGRSKNTPILPCTSGGRGEKMEV